MPESGYPTSGKWYRKGVLEQKQRFEERHIFDSPNKPAAKRGVAVIMHIDQCMHSECVLYRCTRKQESAFIQFMYNTMFVMAFSYRTYIPTIPLNLQHHESVLFCSLLRIACIIHFAKAKGLKQDSLNVSGSRKQPPVGHLEAQQLNSEQHKQKEPLTELRHGIRALPLPPACPA